MPYTSKWPYSKFMKQKVDVPSVNFDGDRSTVGKGPDYHLLDNESSGDSSVTDETMTDESYQSPVPKKKTGLFKLVLSVFKLSNSTEADDTMDLLTNEKQKIAFKNRGYVKEVTQTAKLNKENTDKEKGMEPSTSDSCVKMRFQDQWEQIVSF
ncbi:hypothetical protein GCK72_025827 [Caenorhabditis remanei]|uniref:Uncharacterized protein n=1 Tax=Caenorhabditis remanei TaxID=31234 RepID=A0A6A5G383_CAERE|nr:hypothetical protein GCK72_025827 [Caenorhabditis remanei]KAF1749360.1 hypothetical protein GCK72_025827 [Caenorhabditis remanei]